LNVGDKLTETFTYTVRDSGGLTSSTTLTVTINGANDAPVAVANTATAKANSVNTINVLSNDTDVDNLNSALSIAGTPTALHGTVTVNADGSLNYTPTTNYVGTDTISYSVRDPGGLTASSTVAVTVKPELFITNADVNEAVGNARITLTLSAAPTSAVVVSYTTRDGEALSNGSGIAQRDYMATSGNVTFQAGQTTATILVQITNDEPYDGPERFYVDLSTSSTAIVMPTTPTITTTIYDDGRGIISYPDNPTASKDNDIPWVTSVNSSAQSEGNTGSTNYIVFNVTMQRAADITTPVKLELNGGDLSTGGNASNPAATIGVDTSTALEVNFGSGWVAVDPVSKTVNVPAATNALTFQVRVAITPDSTYELNEFLSLTATATSPVDGGTRSVTGSTSIQNDDSNPQMSVVAASFAEDTGTANVHVTLTNPRYETVTVQYSTAGNAATSGTDFTAATGTLTFAPGETDKVIPISIINDSVAESSEAFTVSLSNVTGNISLSGANASITINDNDTPLTLTGTSAANTLIGQEGADTLSGLGGNDTLVGNGGNDILIGGTGNDALTGGLGSDTFRWALADRGTTTSPATDTINDFNTATPALGGDVLDLASLLTGENHTTGTGNLGNYLHFEYSDSGTIIHISSTGAYGTGGYASTKDVQRIVMTGVDLTAGGTATDAAIIQDLLTKGKLITD